MSHPCLVTLSERSSPRVLFAGDRLIEVPLPAGARVLYPRPCDVSPLESFRDRVEAALASPFGAEPLASQLRPGMKVTVVLDPLRLPGVAARDPRADVLDELLPLLNRAGVNDVEVVVAGGLERRLTSAELRTLVGRRAFKALWPRRIYSHDPEDSGSLVAVGATRAGAPIQLPRRVVQSDLVIAVRLHAGTVRGFGGPLLRGLGGHRAYLEYALAGALSSPTAEELGAFEKLKCFTLEVVLAGPAFAPEFAFLGTNEDELTAQQRSRLELFRKAAGKLPGRARQLLLQRTLQAPVPVAVYAGEPAAATERARLRAREIGRVPIDRAADVLVTGVPHVGVFDAGAPLNPLLVSAFVEGFLFNQGSGSALVKPGGTLVLLHPCTDRFDRRYTPYDEFFHEALASTSQRDELALTAAQFAKNPALIQMFRNGDAPHPVHPYLVWMWGESARNHLGRVIVVGADNEYVPRILGFETAPNLDQALFRAREGARIQQDILCLHAPLDASVDVERIVSGLSAFETPAPRTNPIVSHSYRAEMT